MKNKQGKGINDKKWQNFSIKKFGIALFDDVL